MIVGELRVGELVGFFDPAVRRRRVYPSGLLRGTYLGPDPDQWGWHRVEDPRVPGYEVTLRKSASVRNLVESNPDIYRLCVAGE